MKAELKDLFRAIQNERTMILRFCNMRDRETMLDHRHDALRMIHEFEWDNELSASAKRFLMRRICRAARETGLM
ncbi:hypothetical protein C805_00064 [Eubacterium sp. 14-2]|uniref:hypothetical protein n=1 Tax=Eubacterium sp. 14-2 TaxID=1235790 RepID=UPI00033D3400|nr:hypothetical protein [Eubacterium sp. 14-2]EOT29481.1 hypothetical protein C805_00064 [Eubacterium sp. 14-2]